MKIYCISLLACLSLACYENVDTGTIPTEDSHTTAKGDAFKHVIGGAVDMSSNTKDVTGSDVSQQDIIKIDIKSEEMLPPAPYYSDGLEIIYTLGNTNIPGDAPFDTTADDINSAGFAADLKFMENWQLMAQDQADQFLTYNMYADPNREFIKYLPQHAWPLSLLITTKDMGVRLVEEGFWSPLMKNKIMLVLYNEVPDIPFE